ncbi:uncharacterized protein LOC135212312 [Macrobrachium nipponense]|uniref:uncharacterized protein LOC135212312 n=1 Tax=Macrobrachium nipponense TaxID=159736 RepID=UPI0030C8C092
MWVGVRKGTWNLTGRVTDNAEWSSGSLTSTDQAIDKCASIENGNNYLLQSYDCTLPKRVLCKKQVCAVSGYEMIPGIGCSIKVGPSAWAQGTQSPCTDNGGSLFSPASGAELTSLLKFLREGSSSFSEDLWINASGMSATFWADGVVTALVGGVTCGYLKKDSNFLLKTDNCTQAKAMLCRIPKPQ